MTLEELIEKNDINQSYLARRIDISRGAFSNKLKRNNMSCFTGPELAAIKKVLSEIEKDLNSYLKEH